MVNDAFSRLDVVPPIPRAALVGFVLGLILSVPVGPINLTIMNEGARRGFRWAALIGLGATAMETVYCFIAYAGFGSLLQGPYIKAAMELFSFAFMLFLGIKFMLVKSVSTPPVELGERIGKFETTIEERLHPSSAFNTGFVRVMGNVGVLVFWIFLAGFSMSREWVVPAWSGRISCVLGVCVGTGLWFVGLAWIVSRKHGSFSERTLLRMEHLSGVGLLLLALIHGGIIVRNIAHHKL
jgi:L-lysine exporter family protein LysE/ArgO